MRLVKLSAVLLTTALAACSGGGGGSDVRSNLQDIFAPGASISPQQRSMVYAYPAPDQTEVIPATPIALRFSHPLGMQEFPSTPAGLQALASAFTLCKADAQGACVANSRVALSAEFSKKMITAPAEPSGMLTVDDRTTVVLLPGSRLAPVLLDEKTRYRLLSNGLMLDTGDVDSAGNATRGQDGQRTVAVQAADVGQPLIFTTRAALEGPVNARMTNLTRFDVEHLSPNPDSFLLGNEGLGLFNFSTIRLQMTQPIDLKSAIYGSSVRILDAARQLVPATFLVKGNQISIDPTADLDPTQRYTLAITSGLKSLNGSTFNGASSFANFSFQPTLASNGESARSMVPTAGLSALLGVPVNKVPVASPLLGQGDRAPQPQAAGTLIANLGTPSNVTTVKGAVVPLRVKKGGLLQAASLVVRLDGIVPANLETDTLNIKLISDANGLLLPNRYSLSPFAPGLVQLQLDFAVSAKNQTSNGAFTQDILHVPVTGITRFNTKDNQILIDAIGTIELKILGTDNAVGVLALQLIVDLDDAPVLDQVAPVTPVVDSWVPGAEVVLMKGPLNIPLVDVNANNTALPGQLVIPNRVAVPGGQLLRPGDPVIVNFSQIMDVESMRNRGNVQPIKLTGNGAPVPFTWRLDGVSLIITPNQPFAHGVPYVVTLSNDITNLDGTRLSSVPLSFTMPVLAAGDAAPNPDGGPDTRRPPVVLGVYPGYPCGVMAGTRNIAGDIQGKCVGGKVTDEDIPLPKIESRRSISATFSQTVQRTGANAIRLGATCNDPNGSFRVERINAAGACIEAVPGALGGTARELRFTPNDPWVQGELYRYILGSSGLVSSTCSAGSICGTNNLPLQTQMISQTLAPISNPQHGGPPMEIVFKVDPAPANVSALTLRLLPNADVDANFRHEPTRGEVRAQCFNKALGGDGNTLQPSGSCDTPNGALLIPDTTTGPGSPNEGTAFEGLAYNGAASRFALGCTEGETAGICEDRQFLRVSSALSASIGGFKPDGNFPTNAQLQASLCSPEALNGGIEVLIDPSLIVTNGADIYAELGLSLNASPVTGVLAGLINAIPVLGPILTGAVDQGANLLNQVVPIVVDQPLFTGPLVFRMRHAMPDLSASAGPRDIVRSDKIPARIEGGCENGIPKNPTLTTSISLYTDIPEIDARADVGLLKTLTDLGIPLVSDITDLVGIPIDQDVRSNIDITNLAVSGTVEFLPDGRLTARLVNDQRVRLSANLSALGGLVAGSLFVTVPEGRFVLNSALAPIKQ